MKGTARPRRAKGRKEGHLGSFTLIMMFFLVATIGGSFWMAIEGTLKGHLEEFTRYAISSFFSLLVVPAILLVIIKGPRRFHLGKLNKGFLITFLVYQVFGIWIIAYYWAHPHYFKKFDLGSLEYISYLFVLAFYVPPVDFVTKRFIQYEVTLSYGDRNGFLVGLLAWVVVHAFEVVWLSELMGLGGSTTFVVVSGIVTGLLYMRYKNVLAMMLGHWTINLMISIVTSSLR